jgi:U3 small nucleolar RNA-associated protein 10
LVKKIGEDFSPLLPETIPFLAELMEDEHYEVEAGVQKAIQEIEKITGESLQKYF